MRTDEIVVSVRCPKSGMQAKDFSIPGTLWGISLLKYFRLFFGYVLCRAWIQLYHYSFLERDHVLPFTETKCIWLRFRRGQWTAAVEAVDYFRALAYHAARSLGCPNASLHTGHMWRGMSANFLAEAGMF